MAQKKIGSRSRSRAMKFGANPYLRMRNPADDAPDTEVKKPRKRSKKKPGGISAKKLGKKIGGLGKSPTVKVKTVKTTGKRDVGKKWKLTRANVKRTWKRDREVVKQTATFLPNPLAGSMTELVTLSLMTAFGAVMSQNLDGMVAVRGTDKHAEMFKGMEGATLVAAKPDAARLIAQVVLFGVSAGASGFAKKKGYNKTAAAFGGIALGTLVNNVLDLFHKVAVPAMPESLQGAYPGMSQANQDSMDKAAEAIRAGTVAQAAPMAPPAAKTAVTAGAPVASLPLPRIVRQPVPVAARPAAVAPRN